MSTNTDSETSGSAVPSYRQSDDGAKSVDEKRRELEREKAEEHQAKAETADEVRKAVGSEKQPETADEKRAAIQDLLNTVTHEFRGIEFEFNELGDAAIEVMEAGSGDEVEAGTERARKMYDVLGEKCVDVDHDTLEAEDIDAEFWANFNIGQQDGDGVASVFFAVLNDSSDIDPDEAEKIKNSAGR